MHIECGLKKKIYIYIVQEPTGSAVTAALYLPGADFKVVVVDVDGGDAVANLELLHRAISDGFGRRWGRGRLADLFDLRFVLLSSLACSLFLFILKKKTQEKQLG